MARKQVCLNVVEATPREICYKGALGPPFRSNPWYVQRELVALKQTTLVGASTPTILGVTIVNPQTSPGQQNNDQSGGLSLVEVYPQMQAPTARLAAEPVKSRLLT